MLLYMMNISMKLPTVFKSIMNNFEKNSTKLNRTNMSKLETNKKVNLNKIINSF